jgi:hypothetical protein
MLLELTCSDSNLNFVFAGTGFTLAAIFPSWKIIYFLVKLVLICVAAFPAVVVWTVLS